MRGIAWMAAGVVLVLAAPVLAGPAPPDSTRTGTPPAGRARWVAGGALDRGHDDNIIQLTGTSLDRFGTSPGPPRFRIARVGDMQTAAAGTLRWRSRLVPQRDTRLALDAGFHRYDHDRIADWREFQLTAEQEITATHRHLLTLGLFGSRIPRYYLGEIIDVDESVAAHTSNRGAIRNSLTYAQTAFGGRLEQEFFRARLTLAGALDRVQRVYNSHFLERTNDNDEWSLSAAAMPFRRWRATARMTWLRGRLDARGDLPDTLGITDTDISYDHDGIGGAMALPWDPKGWHGHFDASFMPEVRHYTTSDKFDNNPGRFHRENHRREVRLRVTQGVWGPIDAIVTWQRLTSRARFADRSVPSGQTDFAEEQFGVQLRARWDLPLR